MNCKAKSQFVNFVLNLMIRQPCQMKDSKPARTRISSVSAASSTEVHACEEDYCTGQTGLPGGKRNRCAVAVVDHRVTTGLLIPPNAPIRILSIRVSIHLGGKESERKQKNQIKETKVIEDVMLTQKQTQQLKTWGQQKLLCSRRTKANNKV